MSGWFWASALLLPLVPVLALLTALLERSGPIRMRHWVEEAGGRLRALYEESVRFELFRYLLNLFAKLVPLALFGCLARALAAGGLESPLLFAGLLVALLIGSTEVASRSLLGNDSEQALRRLTGLYRLTLMVLMPLVLLISPLIPKRRAESESAAEATDEASEEEVEAFIDVGTKEGILEPEDRALVWGVVDFGDTQVRSVMTPRIDIVAASADEALDSIVATVLAASVSRLPLYRDSIDQIVGIVHIRDLLAAVRQDPQPSVAEIAKPPLLVPETKLLGELLKMLQARRQEMAIVINEFGGTEGLVTIEDLVEEIVGEIQDEHDDAEPENRMLEDGSLLLDGRAAIETLDEHFSWRPEADDTETVGGLVSGLLGYVPANGEAVEHRNLRFEVEHADERRILSLRVRRIQVEGEGGDG